jgi:hypothetical protein
MKTTTYQTDDIRDGASLALSIEEFKQIVNEAISQPPWRLNADMEADYADGNQLATDLLQKQKALGIPPAKENIIGPAIRAVCGFEAKTRTDWRVTPDGDPAGQDMADATNYKINQAERHSKADRAMSKAFQAQITVGLGWVEVARAPNSLMFPIQSRYVHRNEIWWDMKDTDPALTTARWLYRRRWPERSKAAQMFPEHKDIILNSMEQWVGDAAGDMLEGGQSTGLLAAMDAQRAWTNVEDAWFNTENRTVCITEVWYRRWVPTLILKIKGGRSVEYDENNTLHQAAVMSGRGKLVEELIPRMRRAYWMGPHMLHDGPTPYPHDNFPYVPFWGYQEDMTSIPFGLVRDMLFPQDNLNSSIGKLRWGMSSVRTERTKGAVAMSDAQFRQTIARSNADIVLDAAHMAQPGARFEVKRDFQLNDQQFNLMNDSRAAIGRMGVSPSFQGQEGTATSGIQEQTQVEQSQVSLADLMDNFKDARSTVGELIMALVIEDLGEEEQTIVIEGDVINPARTVIVNKPEVDPVTGMTYLSNDIQRARLRVSLEDVPSSSSFRAQQLSALSESVKSMPPEMQQVVMPFMIDLMDLPRKKEVVEALRGATGQTNPEQLREQIKQELMVELKTRELDIKERVSEAQIKQLMAQAVQTGVQAAFSAMQGGAQVAMNPMIAPIADEIMKGAGYQLPTPGGVDPNFPIPDMPAPVQDAAAQTLTGVQQNTSPAFPPVPQGADQGMTGIETPATADNLGALA